MLSGLARHAGAVPIAETDLLAAWLAGEAAVDVPDSGPLTVAIADAETVGRQDRRRGDRCAVAALGARCYWPRAPPTHSTSLSSTTPE